ncbi:MAG: glucokinase [Pseudomonadota bacterium]
MNGYVHPDLRWAVVGDIGGTNARFGLVDLAADRLEVSRARGFKVSDFVRATDALTAYLAENGLTTRLSGAAMAVAGPVENGAIRLTNSHWTLSEAELLQLGFGSARLLNDYAALALSTPLLDDADVRVLGPRVEGAPGGGVAVVGPGTGFGVSALVRDDLGEAVLTTEGGHSAYAPEDEVEIEILRRLGWKYGRVSIERVLCGQGMRDLHDVLAETGGRKPPQLSQEEVTRLALAGDPDCLATVERFCAILGGVAGDFALTLGARGGVFIAGGIPPRILEILEHSRFRSRFEAKGRFQPYLAAIPTRVIVRPHAALLGAANGLRTLLQKENVDDWPVAQSGRHTGPDH